MKFKINEDENDFERYAKSGKSHAQTHSHTSMYG